MVVKNHLLDEYQIIRDQATHLANEEKRWELVKTSRHGVKIFKLPASHTKFNHTIFRAECYIPNNIDRVFDMIHPCTKYYRSEWDSFVSSIDLLEEINERVFTVRVLPVPILKGVICLRDTIEICGFEEEEDTKVFISKPSDRQNSRILSETKIFLVGSVTDADHPGVKGFVRAWTYPSGIFCKKTDNPEVTFVTGIFHCDLKSYVPHSVLDAAFPFMITQYYEALQKTDTLDYTPLVDVPGKRAIQ